MLANTFARRVMLLLSGSVLAQALPLAVTPILSRIYSPDQLGVLGLFVAFVGIIGPLVTLRYENAILLPGDNEEALKILYGVVTSSIAISLLFLVILLTSGSHIFNMIGIGLLYEYVLWLPLSICLMGIMQGLNSWLIRCALFRQLTYSRISQSGTTAISQLVAGFLSLSSLGLLIGQVLGQFASIFAMMMSRTSGGASKLIPSISLLEMHRIAKRYKRFPIYSLPADALNAFASYLPFFILAKFFGPHVVGLYVMMLRVTQVPISLVGNAVSDVFKERAIQHFREGGNCRPLVLKTLLSLFSLSVPPALLLFFWGPELFIFVLGEKWGDAGSYASVMALLLAIRFAASPVGFVLYVAEKQHVDLFWQIALLLVNLGALLAGAHYGDPKLCIAFFSLSYSIMYFIYIYLAYFYAKSDEIKLKQERNP